MNLYSNGNAARRKFTSLFKARAAKEALLKRAVWFELHPNRISNWKKEFLEYANKVFDVESNMQEEERINERDELLAFASGQKEPAKASCIEAIEYATGQDVSLADRDVLEL